MDIRRVIDGKEHIISLSNEEIEQAFRIREHEYLSQDVECQLNELGSVRGLPAELFQNKQFYEDVIYRAEKMDAHNEDIQYAIEDVTDRLTDEEIAKYIKPKLVEFCEQMENRVFISDDNTITVCRYYEGRNNAVSRISSYCCPIEDAYDALRTSDPLDELLYRSRVTAIYENEPEFCKEVLRIRSETPSFSASDDNFAAKLESKLHTEKYSLVHDGETEKEQAATEIFALDGKVKYRILETDDQKYKYNVQIWTQCNAPAQTGYVYAGNGRFCETLDDAQSFVETDIADRTDRANFSQVIETFAKAEIKPEQIDAINEQLKSYSVYVVDDAYNGHKRSEYEQTFKSLDEAIDSYKKSRDVGHDIVGICDSNRKHLIKYMDGNETIYLSAITSEENKQKILEATIEKPVASVQKTYGR